MPSKLTLNWPKNDFNSLFQLHFTAKAYERYASTTKQHKLNNHAWNVFESDICCEQRNNNHVLVKHASALINYVNTALETTELFWNTFIVKNICWLKYKRHQQYTEF